MITESQVKLYKTIRLAIILVIGSMVLRTLIFLSQFIGTSSTPEELRDFMTHFMKADSAKFAAFQKTSDYRRFEQTKSPDTLDKYLAAYAAFKPDSISH